MWNSPYIDAASRYKATIHKSVSVLLGSHDLQAEDVQYNKQRTFAAEIVCLRNLPSTLFLLLDSRGVLGSRGHRVTVSTRAFLTFARLF